DPGRGLDLAGVLLDEPGADGLPLGAVELGEAVLHEDLERLGVDLLRALVLDLVTGAAGTDDAGAVDRGRAALVLLVPLAQLDLGVLLVEGGLDALVLLALLGVEAPALAVSEVH